MTADRLTQRLLEQGGYGDNDRAELLEQCKAAGADRERGVPSGLCAMEDETYVCRHPADATDLNLLFALHATDPSILDTDTAPAAPTALFGSDYVIARRKGWSVGYVSCIPALGLVTNIWVARSYRNLSVALKLIAVLRAEYVLFYYGAPTTPAGDALWRRFWPELLPWIEEEVPHA